MLCIPVAMHGQRPAESDDVHLGHRVGDRSGHTNKPTPDDVAACRDVARIGDGPIAWAISAGTSATGSADGPTSRELHPGRSHDGGAWCGSSSAYARPSPRPAPVTTATWPSNQIIASFRSVRNSCHKWPPGLGRSLVRTAGRPGRRRRSPATGHLSARSAPARAPRPGAPGKP